MTGRISTQGMYLQSLRAILDQQASLADTQLQVATGRRFQTAAGDPVAASRELDLDRSLARLDQFGKNLGVANHRLSLQDDALGDVTGTLQRVRELALVVNTDTNDASGEAVAQELDQLLEHLVQVANTSDGEGGYLFAGFSSGAAPFLRDGSPVTYRGDQGQRFIRIGPDRQVADGDSGAEVFESIRNGNGSFTTAAVAANTGDGVVGAGAAVDPAAWVPDNYSINFLTATDYEVVDGGGTTVTTGTYDAGAVIAFNGIEVDITGAPAAGDSFRVSPSMNQDVFATIQNLIDVARQDPAGAAQRAVYHSEINSALIDIDQALDHVALVRTRVGARLNALDDQSLLNEQSKISLETTLSEVRDADLVETVSRMELQRVSLQAAQQAFVRLQGLSLFRLLG